jgi:hypothetical protein
MEFIKNLTVSKEEIKKIWPTHHGGYWWKLNHEKYIQLVGLFDHIDQVEQIDKFNDHSPYRDNSTYALEFFALYVYGINGNKRVSRK